MGKGMECNMAIAWHVRSGHGTEAVLVMPGPMNPPGGAAGSMKHKSQTGRWNARASIFGVGKLRSDWLDGGTYQL